MALQVALHESHIYTDDIRIQNPSKKKKTVSQCLTVHTPETIMEWHRQFRNNNESFPSPKYFRAGKNVLPVLLDRYPNLKNDLVKFMVDNLGDLTIELVHEFLIDIALPKIVDQRKKETEFSDFTMDHLLRENGLKKLTITTTWRWMKILGMKYSERRKNREMGFVFEAENGEIMFEFHVDQHPSFHVKMNRTTEFGGNLSVRKKSSEKQMIIFGQDECIFRQYIFSNKSWKKPDGGFVLVPKDEGQGIMMSSFTSREFGFGFVITPEQLKVINKFRKGKHYSDRVAAKNRLGTTLKAPLKSSPLSISFEYGANAQGYWNYEAMAIQFEDCVDCLLALYGDKYHFVFLFDHSSGHDKKRPDGLNINKMIKTYGGSQPVMRPSLIQDETYIGPYYDPSNPVMVSIGKEQMMVFTANDEGPFYLSKQHRERLRSDLNVPLKITEERIEVTWIGKPKGKFQILYERGFIDPNRISSYTLTGKVENGVVNEELSINKLMEMQCDFKEEETLLQYHGRMMGVTVDRSPKCHPEIAGEGIEYHWGELNVHVCFLSVRESICWLMMQCLNVMILLNHSLIEKVLKVYKSHRSMIDQDKGFISSVVQVMRNDGDDNFMKTDNNTHVHDNTNSDVDVNDDDGILDVDADDELDGPVFPSDLPPLIRDGVRKMSPPQKVKKLYQDTSTSGSDDEDSMNSKVSKDSWIKVKNMMHHNEDSQFKTNCDTSESSDEESQNDENGDEQDDYEILVDNDASVDDGGVDEDPNEFFIQDAFVLSSAEDSSDSSED